MQYKTDLAETILWIMLEILENQVIMQKYLWKKQISQIVRVFGAHILDKVGGPPKYTLKK